MIKRVITYVARKRQWTHDSRFGIENGIGIAWNRSESPGNRYSVKLEFGYAVEPHKPELEARSWEIGSVAAVFWNHKTRSKNRFGEKMNIECHVLFIFGLLVLFFFSYGAFVLTVCFIIIFLLDFFLIDFKYFYYYKI